MPMTLHAAFVPSCQQVLGAMLAIIDKAESFASEHGVDDSELLEAKLADTMWSLPWHVRSCWVHSAYVIGLLPTGEFSPNFTDVPDSWDGMRTMIGDAQARLAATSPDELEAVADTTIGFVLGGRRLMEMTGSNFLLSFSQPNFYFHAATFYDILRMKGLPLSKMDFMGRPRAIAG